MLRQKLIDAAARVYGEYGFRGATTRRIAQEAGVNEVTIFRHFGSKDALIAEVVRCHAAHHVDVALPETPVDPERELTEWAAAHLAALREQRALIRKTMGELEERPDVACAISEGTGGQARQLKSYMQRLAKHGFVQWDVRAGRDELAHAAGAMLMGALFADAMGRDMLAEMYPQPPERAAAMYVRLFLRAVACRSADELRGRDGAARGGTARPGAKAAGAANGAKPTSRKPAVSKRASARAGDAPRTSSSTRRAGEPRPAARRPR